MPSQQHCRRLHAILASLDDLPPGYRPADPPWKRAWDDRLSARERTGLTLEDEDRLLDRICAERNGCPLKDYQALLARKLARRSELWTPFGEGGDP